LRIGEIKPKCDQTGVAFFFKQGGAWEADGQKRSKKANGRRYHGKVWEAMPALSFQAAEIELGQVGAQ
jgi:protein gp37